MGDGELERPVEHHPAAAGAAVEAVITSNSAAVPKIVRAEKADPHRQEILELLPECAGEPGPSP